jgi:DNA-binding MarR family transcriptional regulator/GNAT superfamily N-acetyltransferase
VDDVETVRRFNRFYTQRIGVLTDRYLGRARPLAEARLLFEVGSDGADVRELRTRLDLDSGYLSRLLRSLEGQRLVAVDAHPDDSRVRRASLTAAGRREVAELNRRAARVAGGLLSPLTPQQRSELLTAMSKVHRLLRLAAIDIEVTDPDDADARASLAAFAEEIGRRFPGGFDEADLVPPEEVRGKTGAFLVAREQGRPVGCGAVRTLAPGIGEIKHLWVHGDARGLGLGRRLVSELEGQAVARNLNVVRLDTHQVLTEAIQLYRTAGYREIPQYDDNPYAYFWFEKVV